tara:strand:- start:216 stop:674 length:459 start_codon:yes stop_codon:yes gene_type:complete
MPALNHKPSEVDDGYPEGTYNAKIQYIDCPYKFSSGNIGMRVYMEVWRENTAFELKENVVTSLPKMKRRLRQFCHAFGSDYDNEHLKSEEFHGKQGQVELARQEGSKWLSVKEYLPGDDSVPYSPRNSKPLADIPSPSVDISVDIEDDPVLF